MTPRYATRGRASAGYRPRHRRREAAPQASPRPHRDAVVLVAVVFLLGLLSCSFIYSSHLNSPPIRSDGYGYFAYLPSIAISHNLSLHPATQHLAAGTTLQAFGIDTSPVTGHFFDKYAPGTAVLMAPFFLIGHLVAHLGGGVPDGYSTPYQAAVTVGGVFYLALGALLVLLTARRLTDPWTARVVTVAIVFATNVFHYGTYDNSFSHVYAFAMMATYVYLLVRLMQSPPGSRHISRLLALSGVALGLITLIRLPDAIVALLLVPVLHHLYTGWARTLRQLVLIGVPGVLLLAPYLLYLDYALGSPFVSPYSVSTIRFPHEPHFHESYDHLTRPRVAAFLFSARKGLFVWAPITLLGVLSAAVMPARLRGFCAAVVVALALQVYLCASWWTWTFGGSFGSRPMVDVMPVLAVPLAFGVRWLGQHWSRPGVWGVVSVLVIVNVALMYSYWLGIIGIDNTTWADLAAVPGRLVQGFWRPGFRLW